MTRKAPPLVIDGRPVTVPVTDKAQTALEVYLNDNLAALDAVLAPFGLNHWDVEVPTFMRVVREGEVRRSP